MRFLINSIYLVAAVIMALVQVPHIADLTKNVPNYVGWIMIIVVLVASIINFLNPNLTPSITVMEMSEANEDKLTKAVQALNKTYRSYGIAFDVNIMLTKTRFFRCIEPKQNDSAKSKFSWMTKEFFVIWSFPDGVDPNLSISINQGVCGAAYREGTATSFTQIKGTSFEDETSMHENFNFTDRQKKMTRSLKLVASCPLVVVTRQKTS